MRHPLQLRRGVVAAVAATAVAGSLALVAPAQAAAPATANSAQRAAIGWLDAQLSGGLLPSGYGVPNYGASADATLSLVAAGDSADATTVADALKAGIDSYISGDDQDPSDDGNAATTFEDVGSTYAGSAAKAAVALEAAGIDPTGVTTHLGGAAAGDLVSRLEAQVQPSGRIQDTSTYGDYENVLGQAFAARALAGAGSAKAGLVTTFLLSQQCQSGYFPEQFAANDGSCGADTLTASVDATATAVLQLSAITSPSAEVTADIAKATAWLKKVQSPTGGFSDDTLANDLNVNSTGLAGWALGATGSTAAAASSAQWVRAHQLANVGACAPYSSAEAGALAFDDAAYAGAVKSGTATDQFWVAASQAIPVLSWLPASTAVLATPPLPSGFALRSGEKTSWSIQGLAAGEPACFTVGSTHTVVKGTGSALTVPLTAPTTRGKATLSFSLTNVDGQSSSLSFAVWAPKHLTVKAARVVTAGSRVKVTVRGLVAGEPVRLTLRGVTVTGKANAHGVFAHRVKVAGKAGRAKIKVTGGIAARSGKATIKIVPLVTRPL